jgi:hypothetical protein
VPEQKEIRIRRLFSSWLNLQKRSGHTPGRNAFFDLEEADWKLVRAPWIASTVTFSGVFTDVSSPVWCG